tara:strand:- start:405 stop:1430 length:1026 start_codon:yes stop_codon:yes gene_type:complete
LEKFLVTGGAGFIGAAVVKELLKRGHNVINIDNLNKYYSIQLKKDRLEDIEKISHDLKTSYEFINLNLQDKKELNSVFEKNKPSIVINLAAQAGVRYSIENPFSYIESNVVGFLNLLEACRNNKIKNLVYASSSSVYGGNNKLPFSEVDPVNNQISLYAATKRSNELMANTYTNLYMFPATGLRFFTVYGPWGRPDMAPMIFAKAILNGENLNIFNRGNMKRDFTYIDDVVDAVIKCAFKVATPNFPKRDETENPSHSFSPHRIFNIGKGEQIKLNDFVEILEISLGKKAKKIMMPMQTGDVKETLSDCSALREWIDYRPSTSIETGVSKFIDWFRDYYGK